MNTDELLQELKRRTEFHASALASQGEQIAHLCELFSKVTQAQGLGGEAMQLQTDHLIGTTAALQVFAELVMGASPEIKRLIAEGTGQILARPDLAQNSQLRTLLSAFHDAATRESRTTPEGRRSWLHLVPSTDPKK